MISQLKEQQPKVESVTESIVWFPASHVLPDDDISVLVAAEEVGSGSGFANLMVDVAYYDSDHECGGWIWSHSGARISSNQYRVTHWADLPKPPAAKGGAV